MFKGNNAFKRPRTLHDYHFSPVTMYSCSVVLWVTILASIFVAAYFADLYFGKDSCKQLDDDKHHDLHFFSFDQLRGFIVFIPIYIYCVIMTVHNGMIQWEFRKNVRRLTNPADDNELLVGKKNEYNGWTKWQQDNTWIYYQGIWWILPIALASCKMSFDRRGEVSWFWIAATCFMPVYYIIVGFKEGTYICTDTRETNQNTFNSIQMVEEKEQEDMSSTNDVVVVNAPLPPPKKKTSIKLPNGETIYR